MKNSNHDNLGGSGKSKTKNKLFASLTRGRKKMGVGGGGRERGGGDGREHGGGGKSGGKSGGGQDRSASSGTSTNSKLSRVLRSESSRGASSLQSI